MNDQLTMVNEWCKANKLSLNHTKSEFMLITNRSVTVTPKIKIGNNEILRVESFKYLGINIDSSLKFQTHIDHLKSRLSQICGVTYRLKPFLDLKSAKKLYYSCAYSIVGYCIATYGGVSQCTQRMNPLIRLQHRIVKNIFSRFYPATTNLFKDVEILKIPEIYKLRVAVLMYRVLKLGECPTLQNILYLQIPQHTYETRFSNELILPFPRVETIRMCFQYQFASVWNSIPSFIKDCTSIRLFKKSLSNYFLNSYV